MVASKEINPAKNGHAALEVQLISGESAVTSSFAASPLKLLHPHPRGTSVWTFTSSFGGGLLAGDQTRLDLHIGAGARCFVGTQASTKVYRNPKSDPCGHVTQAQVGAEALLVFAPDPVQPFAGSTYTQKQEFHLGADANLALVDWFSAGRTARGERWAFSHFQSRNEVFISGERVMLDSVHFDTTTGPLDNLHRTGRFNCLAMLALVGPDLNAFARITLESTGSLPVSVRTPLIVSASPLRDGVLLRVAGESVEEVGRELHRHLAPLEKLLGDDPWSRKW